jgi:hypothetical protein
MRRFTKLLLGTLGIAATAGSAVAADRVHVVQVALPDGSVRQIRYTADVAPRVILVPIAAVPPAADPFGDGSPFAMLDRVSAMMDAQAGAMMRQAALFSQAQAPTGVPEGVTRYSYTAFSSTGGGCTRSVQMTSFAPGQPLKVVRQSAGDCRGAMRAPVPAAAPAAPGPVAAAPIIPARYVAPAARPKATPVT